MTIRNFINCARCAMRDAVVPWSECFNFYGAGENDLLGAERNDLKVVSVFGGSDYAHNGHGGRTVCANVRRLIDQRCVIERHDTLNPQMNECDVVSFVSRYDESGCTRYKIYCESKTQAGIRFGVCKELMHILTETVNTIEDVDKYDALFYSRRYWRYILNPSYPDAEFISDEAACFYLAIETLIPSCLRAQLESVCSNHNLGSLENINIIAQAFHVPAQVILHVLGQYPGIRRLADGRLLIDSYFKSVSNPMNDDLDEKGRVCSFLCYKARSK